MKEGGGATPLLQCVFDCFSLSLLIKQSLKVEHTYLRGCTGDTNPSTCTHARTHLSMSAQQYHTGTSPWKQMKKTHSRVFHPFKPPPVAQKSYKVKVISLLPKPQKPMKKNLIRPQKGQNCSLVPLRGWRKAPNSHMICRKWV